VLIIEDRRKKKRREKRRLVGEIFRIRSGIC